MRLPSAVRTTTASSLLAYLAVLATGLPSHHHGRPGDAEQRLIAPDHHSHGTLLVEQDVRVPTAPLEVHVAAASAVAGIAPAVTRLPATADVHGFRPTERAPPLQAPRPPPFSV